MSHEHSSTLRHASTEYRELAGKLRQLARACFLSVTLFEKIPIDQALAGDDPKDDTSQITNQLNLFAY
jgi:hypothetical protein